VNNKPTIKHLLEELKMLGVDPSHVRISGKTFDNIMIDVEEQKDETEENPEDE